VPPPGQNTRNAGVTMPSSSAATATAILNVDPGEYRPWIARFCSGRSLSVVSDAQVLRSMPPEKSFGSNAGRLTSDRISPELASSMIADPLNPVAAKPSCAAFCRS
jgi:hypothetical protein